MKETNRYREKEITVIDLGTENESSEQKNTCENSLKREKKKTDRFFLLCGIFFLLLFVILSTFLLRYYYLYCRQKQMNADFVAIRQREVEERDTVALEMDKQQDDISAESNNAVTESAFFQMNSDYVGYISIPDTNISYPIVQSDNSYYLKHDFYQAENRHGAIFLDENCNMTDDILLIHGHHMKDGTMFGVLKNYKKEDFRDNHRLIYIDRGFGDEAYTVFSVFLIDFTKEKYFDYSKIPTNQTEKTTYLTQMKDYSIWFDQNVYNMDAPDGQMVLLSTCEYGSDDQRLIVGAIKITE